MGLIISTIAAVIITISTMSENIEFTKKGNKDKDKDQSMTELSKFSEVFPNIEENNIEKLDSDNATKEGTNDSDISSDSINNISELPIKNNSKDNIIIITKNEDSTPKQNETNEDIINKGVSNSYYSNGDRNKNSITDENSNHDFKNNCE